MANYYEISPPGPESVAFNIIFKTLWTYLPHKSAISGLWLRSFVGTPLFPNVFLPILNTKEWPYFRHYLKNYILSTPGEYGLWTQCKEEERIQYALGIEEASRGKETARWEDLKKLQEELMKEYKRYFPSTRGMIVNYQYNLKEQGRIIGILNKKYLSELRK